MKVKAYMIVFTGSLARLRNFETQKKVLKTLEFFPACNTINNFDYYSNFSLNRSYTNEKYLNAEETRNWLGKLGCNVSHQMMYDSFLKTDADWCLVTEDDCVIKNYCENKINQVLEICKQNNSNFVQLYTNPGFRKLQEKNTDFFIFGHRHLPINFDLSDTVKYINLGDWISYYTYAEFDGETTALKSF